MSDTALQILWYSIVNGSIYGLLAMAIALQYRLLGILNFSIGHIFTLGAYILFFFTISIHLPIWIGIIISMITLICISAFIFRIFIVPFLGKNILITLISTLALSIIIEQMIQIFFGASSQNFSYDTFTLYTFGNIHINSLQITIVGITLCIFSLLTGVLYFSSFGRNIRALSLSKVFSESLGINKNKILTIIFIITSLIAGLAGILMAFETNLQPNMGFSLGMKAFAAMIIGGLGNVPGSIIGAYLIAFVENISMNLSWGDFSLSSGWKDAIVFSMIFTLLLIRPYGIFSTKGRKQ
jgi:branched-subunit amino acid ABC-type transport system permease component